MDEEAQYTDILDDETLAPLKRNHACLQVRCRSSKLEAVNGYGLLFPHLSVSVYRLAVIAVHGLSLPKHLVLHRDATMQVELTAVQKAQGQV